MAFHNIWAEELLKFAKLENLENLEKNLERNLERKVAIIGAGPAGLVAAYELSKKTQFKVDIFEKSRRVGGRVLTVGETECEALCI